MKNSHACECGLKIKNNLTFKTKKKDRLMSTTCYIIYIKLITSCNKFFCVYYTGSDEGTLSQHITVNLDHIGQQAGSEFSVEICHQNATAKKDMV